MAQPEASDPLGRAAERNHQRLRAGEGPARGRRGRTRQVRAGREHGPFAVVVRDRRPVPRGLRGAGPGLRAQEPARVPGAVVVESGVGRTGHLPVAVSIGWVVRSIGAGKLWLGGLIPTPLGIGQTYHWLLRDGAVKAYQLNGRETWD